MELLGETILMGFTLGLTSLAIFIQPVQNSAATVNTSIATVVNEDVTEFVDSTRSQGYISGNDYKDLIDGLTSTGNSYDIVVTLDESKYYPDSDSGKYLNAYETKSQAEIQEDLGAMTAEDKYSMKAGDYLYVSVTQTNVSIAQRLSGIMMNTTSTPQIIVKYGGIVGNEAD